MNFYEKYAAVCRQHGESPSSAALKIGLTKTAVSSWKTRGNFPTNSSLKKVCDYFHVPYDYFDEKEKQPTKGELPKTGYIVLFPEEQDELWRRFYDAMLVKDVTEGFVRERTGANILSHLRIGTYRVGALRDLHAVSVFLDCDISDIMDGKTAYEDRNDVMRNLDSMYPDRRFYEFLRKRGASEEQIAQVKAIMESLKP